MPSHGTRKSLIISLVALFASLHALLGSIPGIWRSWIIAIEPLEGIMLGPSGGALAALIGEVLARFIRPRSAIMFIFGLGEPVGALVAGLAYKRRYTPIILAYTSMLAAYFVHPLGRTLPAWCLWDIYLAYGTILILPLALRRAGGRLEKYWNPINIFAVAFIGIEADVLTRIFLFIPLELYKVMGVPEGALFPIWVAGAFETPVESLIGSIATVTIGIPLMATISKSRLIEYPLT